MLNKLREFINAYHLMQSGDCVICAVSGGADSVAMLFALYLMRERLGIDLRAAHFNHGLRGNESNRDEEFVRQLCDRLDIPLFVGCGKVVPGKKGLEAAARDARYSFLKSLSGKIATAHTADDNAETVLMHLVRGTGLRGLGGIAPLSGRLIRPMLSITREEILAFLQEYHLAYVSDSSNDTDLFMRNRLRHHVMPLLQRENPKLAENLSAMALRLREDERTLQELSAVENMPDVYALRQMPQALRNRLIVSFLSKCGFHETEAAHIGLVNDLIFSENPSAHVILSESTVISRRYNNIVCESPTKALMELPICCPGTYVLDDFHIVCAFPKKLVNSPTTFTVLPKGRIIVRCRQAGDMIRLQGGTKSLKKLFIDRKIPAAERCRIPVVCDDEGVLGVYGIGANIDRLASGDGAVEISFIRNIAEK